MNIIGVILAECDSIEEEIAESRCIEEKASLMADYQALCEAWKDLNSLEELL